MLILPAFDFRGGALARQPGTDPNALLSRWHDASWFHVADLDRAFGTGQNDALVAGVLRAASRPVQVGGALSAPDEIRRWLDAGAQRVIVGAHADHAAIAEGLREAGRLGVAMDVTDGRVTPPGRAPLDIAPEALAQRAVAAGIRTLVWRDRVRDGTLAGADLEGARRLMTFGADVQYAGGVADLDDLRRARDAGFAGVIVGRALLDGRFTLEEAIACSA